MASIKNFILTDDKEDEDFMLFGREEENSYEMHVKYPISLFQAFAIGISSIEK